MQIGGFQKFTLSDYPGKIAAVIFTQGCNFRCPFCHNGSLIPFFDNPAAGISEKEVFGFLKSRVGRCDGVVLSGGEPTLQQDLIDVAHRLKAMGFLLKLDTNGSRPDVIERLLDERLLDFVAMDVKAPLHRYQELAGVPVTITEIRRSIDLIATSGIDHLFRTTRVPTLLSDLDMDAIRKQLPEQSPYRVQSFRAAHALDRRLRIAENSS